MPAKDSCIEISHIIENWIAFWYFWLKDPLKFSIFWLKEQVFRPSALLPLLEVLGPRLFQLQLTKTDSALEDIRGACPNLLKLAHSSTNSKSSLAKLQHKFKHLTDLLTTEDLDLHGFQKLFHLAPWLQHLSLIPPLLTLSGYALVQVSCHGYQIGSLLQSWFEISATRLIKDMSPATFNFQRPAACSVSWDSGHRGNVRAQGAKSWSDPRELPPGDQTQDRQQESDQVQGDALRAQDPAVQWRSVQATWCLMRGLHKRMACVECNSSFYN